MPVFLALPKVTPYEGCGLEQKVTDFVVPKISRFSRSGIKHNTASACFCLALYVFCSAAFAAPEDDLRVMFRSDNSLPPPGGIAGTITNSSAQHYDCVDLVFRLIYKKGASGSPTEQRVRVESVSPRSVTKYAVPLQSKAGFGLQGIEICASEPGGDLPVPRPKRDCTVTGQVTSTMNFVGIGDRGQTEKIEKVFLLTPDGKLVSEDFISKSTNHVREFSFSRLPANLSYVVQLSYAWKTTPPKLTFRCPDSRGRYEFRIGPLKHIGNRLGG